MARGGHDGDVVARVVGERALAVHQIVVEAHELAQERGMKAEYADEVVHAAVVHVHVDEHLTNLH